MPSFSNVLKQLPIRDLFSDDIIGDSKRAAKIYSTETQSSYPQLAFQYFASFSVNTGNGFAVSSPLSFYIKSFDRPSVAFDVQTLNQYNKRRVVQTGLQYGPVTVTFYDTSDRIIQLLFVDYCRHYYGDFSETKDDRSWTSDITAPEFFTDAAGWGFTPSVSPNPNMMYYFDHIDLFDVSADGSYTAWRMMHPVVESWTLGTNDYESSSQKTISFTFRHEGFDVLANTGPAGAFDMDQQFRLAELSQHAELPSGNRTFLNNAASITRDISSGNFSNIATRLGLPLGGVISSIQNGKVNPIAIGSDAIRVIKGSSALNSFGSFVFGDVASSALGSSALSGALAGGSAAAIAVSQLGGTTGNVSSQAFQTPQTAVSQAGQVSTALSTAISGTDPGVQNASGTVLPKNFVNTLTAAGPVQPSPGVDTNTYQAAQGLVQTGPRMSDDFRDALAGAVVTASKNTGQSPAQLARQRLLNNPAVPRSAPDRELALTAQALNQVNRLKPSSAQYGFKSAADLNALDPDARRIIAAKRR